MVQPRERSGPARRRLIRAAASSMANGSPSSRRQIAAMAGAFVSLSKKSERTALARSTNSATASLARMSWAVGTPASAGSPSGST